MVPTKVLVLNGAIMAALIGVAAGSFLTHRPANALPEEGPHSPIKHVLRGVVEFGEDLEVTHQLEGTIDPRMSVVLLGGSVVTHPEGIIGELDGRTGVCVMKLDRSSITLRVDRTLVKPYSRRVVSYQIIEYR